MGFPMCSNLNQERAIVLKKNQKRAVAEEPSPPPFPLSLSSPLTNSWPTTTKCFGPADSLLHNIFVASAITCSIGALSTILFTIIGHQIIDWHMSESQNNNVFIILWSSVTQVFRGFTRVFRGKGVVWDNLPLDLWGEIGKRLRNRLDILCFRSVCKQWRLALPTPTRFPLLVPPLPNCHPGVQRMPHFITEISLYCSKQGLRYMSFEEVGQGSRLRTHNVYPRYDTKLLKSQEHPHSKMSFLSKGYCLRMGGTQMNISTKKVVLISSDADGVHPSYAEASTLSVVALLSWGTMQGRLALLRLGRSSENRVWDTNFCTQVFESIGSYKGRLCTLDYLGRVFLMDYNSLQLTQVAPPLSVVQGPGEKQLFEADGDLYLAHYKKKGVIEGYKLSERYNKWLKPKEGIDDKLSALVPYLSQCSLFSG